MRIGISGSWRTVNNSVEADVRQFIRKSIKDGNTIVSGGALGVDWIATDEAIKIDASCSSVKVIIPTSLSLYSRHYFNRAEEGVIMLDQAKALIDQLETIRDRYPQNLEEMSYEVCTPETYYARNQRVVDECNELAAFQVNKSQGTQDAIDRARGLGKNVMLFEYTIQI